MYDEFCGGLDYSDENFEHIYSHWCTLEARRMIEEGITAEDCKSACLADPTCMGAEWWAGAIPCYCNCYRCLYLDDITPYTFTIDLAYPANVFAKRSSLWRVLILKTFVTDEENVYCPVSIPAWLWKLEFASKNWNPKALELFCTPHVITLVDTSFGCNFSHLLTIFSHFWCIFCAFCGQAEVKQTPNRPIKFSI